jgi:putative membrane protein
MTILSFRFRFEALLLLPLVLLPLLLLAPNSFAARHPPTNLRMDQGSEKMAKSSDIAFLLKAAQSGIAQVQLGRTASEKAASPAVKELGAQLADEYGKTLDQLRTFAAQRYMTLAMTMNANDQEVYTKLQNKSGPSFDKDYMKAIAKDHKSDINLFKKEAKKGRDEQIQRFASDMLPRLRDHLVRIQSLRSSAKAAKSGETGR